MRYIQAVIFGLDDTLLDWYRQTDWMNAPHIDHKLGGVVPDYEIPIFQELLPILTALEEAWI